MSLENDMSETKNIRFKLFKHSERSFIEALDAEGIPHGRPMNFSTGPQNSGIVETISALSEAVPWNSIAKVIIKWVEARKSREVIITTEDNKITHAKG